ncbi:hypothetical protein B6E66_21765 [Streptomyces maremycinicus]|nr:hypothetical protein B6E66_21765 [Streptomyces sp. B9173]
MDLERAVELDPEDLSYRFEKLMLETVEGELEACAEQWNQLLTSSFGPLNAIDVAVSGLFQALLVEPENRVTEATEELLAAQLEPDTLTEVLSYLAELSAVGNVADRARQCRDLIIAHTSG